MVEGLDGFVVCCGDLVGMMGKRCLGFNWKNEDFKYLITASMEFKLYTMNINCDYLNKFTKYWYNFFSFIFTIWLTLRESSIG